jgi:hypothetical protein
MRWTYKTFEDKKAEKSQWKKFFAWYPVVLEKEKKRVWLEWVERKYDYHSDWGESWFISKYRSLQKND